MSAFVVGHDHIDGLLTFAVNNHVAYFWANARREITPHNATEIGRLLLAENERSVSERYRETDPKELPGTTDQEASNYTFREWFCGPLPSTVILKACDCFDYQACETDDYEASHAYKIVDAIRGFAIRRLAGYSDAPGWELRRPNKNLRDKAGEVAPVLITSLMRKPPAGNA